MELKLALLWGRPIAEVRRLLTAKERVIWIAADQLGLLSHNTGWEEKFPMTASDWTDVADRFRSVGRGSSR